MSEQDSVIAALQQALTAAPDDDALRLHLAGLLQDRQQYQQAIGLFQQLLNQDPSHLPALQGAADCAKALGQTGRATGYRTLLRALGSTADDTDGAAPPLRPAAATDNASRVQPAVPTLRVVGGSQGPPADATDADPDGAPPALTLADVGGMQPVKRRLQLSFLGPLQNPALMAEYGKDVSGGLLLYGPPGCGKTFIARALAGELGARFLSVGLADVLDMYLGESERRLHELFEQARRQQPAVLFFDELDAIGQKRSQLRSSGMRPLVNQLLAEMDSVGADNRGLFIIGATNHPWDVDAALKRPGRFDRTVAVFPPDAEARSAILAYHLERRPAQQLDLTQLAGDSTGFSGADLKHWIDSAVDYVLEECIDSGQTRPLGAADFARARRDIRPSTSAWFETARNYAQFANDGGAYDDLLAYLREHKP